MSLLTRASTGSLYGGLCVPVKQAVASRLLLVVVGSKSLGSVLETKIKIRAGQPRILFGNKSPPYLSVVSCQPYFTDNPTADWALVKCPMVPIH